MNNLNSFSNCKRNKIDFEGFAESKSLVIFNNFFFDKWWMDGYMMIGIQADRLINRLLL